MVDFQNDTNPDSHYRVTSDDLIQGDLNAPGFYGEREEFVIAVPINENATVASFVFVLRSVDDAGLMSEFSNVAQATLRKYIPPSGPSKETSKGLTGGQIAMIVCLSVGGVLALIVIIGIVLKCSHGKQKVEMDRQQPTSENDGNANKNGKTNDAYDADRI